AEEGIFTGISAGATVAAALEVAKGAAEGAVILAMRPDTGERYFSTPLFEGVAEGSDDEWLAGLPGGLATAGPGAVYGASRAGAGTAGRTGTPRREADP